MRFVRTIAGTLLLSIGLPALLAGGVLGTLASHRGPDGAFDARLEPARTAGYALVVPDLAAALRDGIPFVRMSDERVTLTARTPAGPAFIGIAPAAELTRYLGSASYATIDGFAVTRGPLPVRLTPARSDSDQASGGSNGPAPAVPAEQSFWTRQGLGTLDWGGSDLDGQRLSLIIMRPDAADGVAADLRGELRLGWLDETSWALLATGLLLVVVGFAVVSWPVRPREVVFVVRPSQVPELAARLGVAALDDVGRGARRTGDWPVTAAPRTTRDPASPAVRSVPTSGRPPAARTGGDQPPAPDRIRLAPEPTDGSTTTRPGGTDAGPDDSVVTAPAELTGVADPPPAAAGDRPALTLADHLTGDANPAGRRPSGATPEPATEPGSPPVALADAARRRASGSAGTARSRGPAGARGPVPPPASLSLAWPPRDARTRTAEPHPIRPVPPPDPVPPSDSQPPAAHAPTAHEAQVPVAGDAHAPVAGDDHAIVAGDAHGSVAGDAHGSVAGDAHATVAGEAHATVADDAHATVADGAHARLAGGGPVPDHTAASTTPAPVSLPSAPPVPAPPPTRPAPVKPTPAPLPGPPPNRPSRPVPTPPPKRPVPVGPGAAGPAPAASTRPCLAPVPGAGADRTGKPTHLRAAVPQPDPTAR